MLYSVWFLYLTRWPAGRGSRMPPQDWGEEIQLSCRSMRCKRGDWVWGEEIWVSEEEFRVGKACDSFIDETTARC